MPHFAGPEAACGGRAADYDRCMPLYEFRCSSCGHAFEELVGPHVGVEEAAVACPQCRAEGPERLVSAVAPPGHGLTPNEKRRLEDKRGIDRGGARERFGRQRAAERARAEDRRG